MSTETIKEFLVGLGFDVEGEAKFTSAIGKATVVAAGLGAAAVVAAGGLFKLAEAAADYFDNLGDMSNRTGVAVSAIEEFGYVAQLSGSSFETANASLESFSRTAGDAASGMGKGQKVFEQLGISVKESNGDLKDTTKLLYEVGDKLKDMDKGKQVAMAQRLGIDKTLIEAITTDVGDLREEFQKLYANAGIDSEKAAEKSGKFMDALDRFNFVLTTVGRSLAVNFMDRFTEALDSLRKLIVDNLPTIMRVLKPIINIVLDIADVFIALAYRAGQAVGFVIGIVADVISKLDSWVVGIGLVVAAWRYLNLAFLATPVGMILAAVAAVGLLIDDFMTWREGGESLVPWGDWADQINFVISVVEVLGSAIGKIMDGIILLINGVVKLFKGDLVGAIEDFKNAFSSWIDGILTVWEPVLNALKGIFMRVFDAIGAYVQGVFDAIVNKIAGIGDKIKGAVSSVTDFFGSDESPEKTGPVSKPNINPRLGADASLYTSSPQPSNQTVSQETNIIVQGSANPQETAAAVGSQQTQVNGDMARNLKGAVR